MKEEEKLIESPEGLTIGWFLWAALFGVMWYFGTRLYGAELPWLWAVILGCITMHTMQVIVQFIAGAMGYRIVDPPKPQRPKEETPPEGNS